MIDKYGRTIEYLRLSITERCNLKCIYCREALCLNEKQEEPQMELSLNEIRKITKAFHLLGIRKFRITGGEPLVRKDVEEIIESIYSIDPIAKICMTTNGFGFTKRAKDLFSAGLRYINFSMDALSAEKYKELTRGGNIKEVLDGIEKALVIGYDKVKINVVLLKELDEGNIRELIAFARHMPVEVRFIELMPLGTYGRSESNQRTTDSILHQFPELFPERRIEKGQPSKDYTGRGFAGKVGFISPMSHEFCEDCNRIRVTSDGKLKLCLGTNEEVEIRKYLMEDSEVLSERLKSIIFNKPKNHRFHDEVLLTRRMNQIGG